MKCNIFPTLLSLYCRPNRFIPRRRRMARWLGRLCPGLPVKTGFGVQMTCNPRDNTFLFAIMQSDSYVFVYSALQEHLQAGMCFIDVGANQGLFSMIASRLVGPSGSVAAFEPSQREFALLLANIRLNLSCNIVPFMFGLGDQTLLSPFSQGPDSHSGINRFDAAGTSKSLIVDLRQHGQLVESVIGGRQCFLKIDVEGHELYALDSLANLLSSSQVNGLIIEISPDNLADKGHDPQAIYDRLDSLGYVATTPRPATRQYDQVFLKRSS